jgi:hypothetical protein
MANLHLIQVVVINSTTLLASFNDDLNEDIGVDNITIQSQLNGINNSTVLSVSISGSDLNITCQPLVPLVSYFVIFQSTSAIPFTSLNGTANLYQAGNTNQYLILGPIEQDNPIQNYLTNYLGNQIYEQVNNPSSVSGSIIQMFAYVLSRALYDVRQVKNENYLNFVVNDELKIRGFGPYDRLDEEAAYEILRVGLTPTNTNAALSVLFPVFPANPVSLLAISYSETLTSSSALNKIATFNINSFILTVSNINVSILTSVVFTYLTGAPNYTYPIQTLGYQILDSTYDQQYAFSYATLTNNQFKLSASILNDPNFSLEDIYQIQVSYQYRDLGRIINQDSVVVTTVLSSSREALPPLETVFNLQHAPITDSNGNPGQVGDVVFLDPNAFPPSAPHPAFVSELVFNLAALPSSVGEYAIDYAAGTVYVFGQDTTNSGTGPEPPLASYDYLYTYVSEIDYVYDPTSNNLVALPSGSLILQNGTINFDYEQVFIPGIDYIADVHIENLDEDVQNRLLASNILQTQNSPVTNVFRIFNQSSGEVYTVNRWYDDKVYFSYNVAPRIVAVTHERASFTGSFNNILFVNNTYINSGNVSIFQCLLPNNQIIAGTQDGLGSSIDTSVSFSETSIFAQEMWFDINEALSNNFDRLIVGQYMVDYANGIIYVAVSTGQGLNIGTISYTTNSINPVNPYVLSVQNIYYQINISNPPNKVFAYQSFSNGSIIPASFDPSDEAYLNENFGAPYQLYNGQVGAFIDTSFYPYVSNSIEFIRGLYEFTDLKYNTSPINFANSATFSGQTINVNALSGLQYANIKYNQNTSQYFVLLNQAIFYQSPNITFDFSVIRNSDGVNLWNSSGALILGSPVTLILSGSGNPEINQAVTIHYSFSINPLSRIIANYNKGDYYIDYTYVADEIIVSYEYGDNYIDWSQSLALSPGDQYYVSYNVGALRDALQKNFGALINIPDLDQFEVNFPRERYRDALTAALTSFLQGPTISAIKNIAQTISHIEPDVTEYAFVDWSLGSSLLTPASIQTTGSFNLVPAKYGNGAVIDTLGQTISLPVNSNLRIGEGTFETWIIPEWNGIDNDAELEINILKDGYLFNPNLVFVGAGEYHPPINLEGIISLNKNDNVAGIPNRNKDGFYIYYAPDITNTFNRWYFQIIDGYSNYADDGYNTNYTVQITIAGLFYDVKSINYPLPSGLRITSGTNNLTFSLNFNSPVNQGITFVADQQHFLMDTGLAPNKNRLSIYKDPSGYLNFRVFDRLGNASSVSSNISSWVAGEMHQVAAAWTLNSFNSRDEIHLFVDGFEVPNIIRYGAAPFQPYLHQKFRTINPEEIAGQVNQNVVGSVDLITTAGSNQVSSSLSFNAYGINPGATLYILEPGFSTAGYTITNVNGNTLTLSVSLPLSITNGIFSINMQSFVLETPIDIYPNITVSTISSILNGNDGYIIVGSNVFGSISFNFTNEGILPGYLLRIDNSNFADNYVVLSVSGNMLVINETAPETISGATFHLYQNSPVELPGVHALRPDYSISEDGYFRPLLTITNGVKANDLILIETLGINNRKIRKFAYQWSNTSNIIQTLLPPPVSINQIDIKHILLSSTLIGPTSNANVSLMTSGNNFSFSINQFDQVQSGTNGRTLAIFVGSDRNLNFTYPVTINISGYADGYLGEVNDGIVLSSFTDLGMPINTTYQFTEITSIDGYGSFYNGNRTFMTLSVREAFPITFPENNTSYYPIIRYSYQIQAGTNLSGNGTNVVSDGYSFFSVQDTNNYLVISSPPQAAGAHQILAVSSDHSSLTLSSTVNASFTAGVYQILNVSAYRSGFQNGFFLFEQANSPGVPFNLAQGSYELEYYTYLSIRIDPMNTNLYLGSDMNGSNLLSGVIDETNISAEMLTDTRVGGVASANQENITKDFNSLMPLTPNSSTLVLLHYEAFPFVNSASFYASTQTNDFIQSNITVNDNFLGSAALYSEPIVINNAGILNTNQGTIEFWVSPKFDTSNDPNYRFYFDATSNIIEEVTSIDEVTVSVSGNIEKVLGITVKDGDPNIDYFAGGRIETSSSGAISEETISLSSSSVRVSKKIFQVVTVKIAGDPTNIDYFDDGTIGTDGVTIYLGRQLPNSNLLLIVTYQPVSGIQQTLNSQVIRLKIPLPYPTTNVIVTYIPAGTQGDRISLFKDPVGYINFNVRASGIDYLVRSPAFWASHTWHRVRATYQFNGGIGGDTIRLFVDGYEQGNILFGTGLIFGESSTNVGPYVFGSTFIGKGSGISTNIIFKDAINELYLGSDYRQTNNAFVLMSNCRFSDIARPVFTPFGESIDVNWNSNLNVVFPVTQDLYTTLLLNFGDLTALVSNFASLINPLTTGFDFAVNVNDEFGIVESNPIVKQVLVAELTALSPASSSMFITYTE